MTQSSAISAAMDALGKALETELKGNEGNNLMKLIAEIRNSGRVYPSMESTSPEDKDYVDLGQFVDKLQKKTTGNVATAAQNVLNAYNNGQSTQLKTSSSNKLVQYFKRGRVHSFSAPKIEPKEGTKKQKQTELPNELRHSGKYAALWRKNLLGCNSSVVNICFGEVVISFIFVNKQPCLFQLKQSATCFDLFQAQGTTL